MLYLNVSHCMYNLVDVVLVLVHGLAAVGPIQLLAVFGLEQLNLVQCSNLSFDFPAGLAHWTVGYLKNIINLKSWENQSCFYAQGAHQNNDNSILVRFINYFIDMLQCH